MAYKLKQTGKKVQDLLDSIEAYPPNNAVDLSSEQNITATKTFSGGISMDNTRIRNVNDPSNDADAATKKYVDTKYNALEAKITELENIISYITIKEE